MKNIILIILLILPCKIFSQNILHVKNLQNSDPIPYAKITIKHNFDELAVFYADSLGMFSNKNLIKSYNINDQHVIGDSIVISSFNFVSKSIAVKDITDIIHLENLDYVMPELIIYSKNKIPLQNNSFTNKKIFIGIPIIGSQVLMLFNNVNDQDKKYFINSLTFYIDKKNKGNAFYARLVVYENINNKPGAQVFVGNPTKFSYSDKGRCILNIENEIEINSKGLFVGIEYMGSENIKNVKQKYIEPGILWCEDQNNKPVYMKIVNTIFYDPSYLLDINFKIKNLKPKFFLEVIEM